MRNKQWFAVSIAGLLIGSTSGPLLGDTLALRNGKILVGRVANSDVAEVTFTFVQAGSSVNATFPEEQVKPHSWYMIRSRVTGNVGTERLALARYATRNGMFSVAQKELARALEFDASLEEEVVAERVHVRDGAAASLTTLVGEAIEGGDLDRAWRLAGTALSRYRGSTSDVTLLAFLDEIRAARAAAAELERVVKLDKAEREKAEARERLLKPVTQYLDRAEERVSSGLRSNQLGRSQSALLSGARAYRNAIKKADDIVVQRANDLDLVASATRLRETALAGMVNANIHMGSLYLVRGSHVKALNHANDALAEDPTNQAALSFRARVEIAAAEAARSRYGRGT